MNDKLVLEIEAAAKAADTTWWTPEILIQNNYLGPIDARFIAIASPANILALITEMRQMETALTKVKDIGHNDDCLFCGFKDKVVIAALKLDEPARAALGGAE